MIFQKKKKKIIRSKTFVCVRELIVSACELCMCYFNGCDEYKCLVNTLYIYIETALVIPTTKTNKYKTRTSIKKKKKKK